MKRSLPEIARIFVTGMIVAGTVAIGTFPAVMRSHAAPMDPEPGGRWCWPVGSASANGDRVHLRVYTVCENLIRFDIQGELHIDDVYQPHAKEVRCRGPLAGDSFEPQRQCGLTGVVFEVEALAGTHRYCVGGSVYVSITQDEAQKNGPDVAGCVTHTYGSTQPPPYAKSDISGDGFADVLTQSSNGDARVYRSRGYLGGLSTFDNVGVLVGTGWGAMTNFDVGDITRDGKADIVAQFANGDARLYLNLGGLNGTWTFDPSGVLVGTGWGNITKFAMGDVDGDRRADILVQFSNGDARIYRATGGYGLSTFDNVGVLVGTGWGAMTNFDLGDVSRDGKADIVAQFANGDARLYLNLGGLNGTWTFDQTGVLVGTGWGGIANFALAHVDSDNRADILAQFSNGEARVYRATDGYGLSTFDNVGVLVGTGWGAIIDFDL